MGSLSCILDVKDRTTESRFGVAVQDLPPSGWRGFDCGAGDGMMVRRGKRRSQARRLPRGQPSPSASIARTTDSQVIESNSMEAMNGYVVPQRYVYPTQKNKRAPEDKLAAQQLKETHQAIGVVGGSPPSALAASCLTYGSGSRRRAWSSAAWAVIVWKRPRAQPA